MGLFSKIKKGIKKAANAVSKAVNKATDAIADAVETIGNGIGDGLSWLGSKIPWVGGVFGWLGDVVSSLTDLVSSLIKGIGTILGGLLSGLIKIVGGILTLDWDSIVEGFGDILAGIVGAVIGTAGKAIAVVQGIFTIGRPRPLNDIELRIIHLVFVDSIATYNVRVVDGFAGIYSINDRPFVLGNTIYMKDVGAAKEPAVFAHECVHVWQNQHLGSGYLADALAGQWWGAGYDWESQANAGKEWEEFEVETQGESIEDVFLEGGTVAGVTGNGTFFAEDDETQRIFVYNQVDWTALANGAVRIIRGHTPWRLSELFY
jgi:hypothetical protein